MDIVTLAFKIDEADREAYIERHQAVFPELLRDFAAAGIRKLSIHMHGGTLFSYMEADDYAAAMAYLGKCESNDRWQAYMADIFAKPGAGQVVTLDEVFRFESDGRAPEEAQARQEEA